MGSSAAASIEEPREVELTPALQELLLEHPGKWAAVTESEIIGLGDTPTEALAVAMKAGVPDVILHRVPDDGNTAYFF